jgi:hypothetical protein
MYREFCPQISKRIRNHLPGVLRKVANRLGDDDSASDVPKV